MNRRFTGLGYPAAEQDEQVTVLRPRVALKEHTLLEPLHWKRPRRVFVCSMTDLFAEWHDDEMIARVWEVMARCPQHTFQVLTKRPERMVRWMERTAMLQFMELRHPLPNVWLGTSVEYQRWADERIPDLLACPAAVHFASCEPLLGPIELCQYTCCPIGAERLDWIITGGESGPRARPADPQWFRDIRDRCQDAEIAFFHKQNGGLRPGGDALLDGRQYHEFPHVPELGAAREG